MSGRLKILIILLIVAVLSAFYLARNFRPSDEKSKAGGSLTLREREADLAELKKNYEAEIKRFFKDYLLMEKNNEIEFEKLNFLKNKLLNLKVPAEFKDLHLNFFIALNRLENYLNSGNIEEKKSSDELIEKIKNRYPWIN